MIVRICKLQGSSTKRLPIELSSDFIHLEIVTSNGEFHLMERDGSLEVRTVKKALVIYPRVSNVIELRERDD